MNYNYRPFDIKIDKELVCDFLFDTQKITGTIPEDREQSTESYISSILRTQQNDPWGTAMLLENDAVIGIIDVFQMKNDPDCGKIRFDYIIPEKRGQGLGRKLLAYASEFLHKKGCKRIILDVVKTNHHAIQFYERQCYSKTGVEKDAFMQMSRTL